MSVYISGMIQLIAHALGVCNSFDYNGFSDSARASIQMTHSADGPTVSLAEAQRLERETAEHLLKSRKLSLIVDLDQTIVHATVDPTVGEWIAEGEAWEARKDRREKRKERAAEKERRKEAKKDDDDSSDDDSSSGEEDETGSEEANEEDECNPNWEALKDVKRFKLGPESFGALAVPRGSKAKQKVIENEGCMYYIKPRYAQLLLALTITKYSSSYITQTRLEILPPIHIPQI